jgi:hypothetical protein
MFLSRPIIASFTVNPALIALSMNLPYGGSTLGAVGPPTGTVGQLMLVT